MISIIIIAPEPRGILKLSSSGIGKISIIIAAKAPDKEIFKGSREKLIATIEHTINPAKKPSQLLLPTLCFPNLLLFHGL